MNPDLLLPLIPIVAMLIPVTAIIFHGMQKVARIKLEETRLRAGMGGESSAPEVASLREEVGELRRELSEVQERLDFTERLLTRAREEAPPPPRGA